VENIKYILPIQIMLVFCAYFSNFAIPEVINLHGYGKAVLRARRLHWFEANSSMFPNSNSNYRKIFRCG